MKRLIVVLLLASCLVVPASASAPTGTVVATPATIARSSPTAQPTPLPSQRANRPLSGTAQASIRMGTIEKIVLGCVLAFGAIVLGCGMAAATFV